MAPRIASELDGLPHVPVSSLEPFQGDLKELSTREYAKLKKSILENGIIVPFFVWLETGKLLDGHQRARVFHNEGWNIDVPVVFISATDEMDAKKKLLAISSQYGKVTPEGWEEFTHDIDDDWIEETVHFDALPYVFEDWLAEEEGQESSDAEPQTSRADELQEIWQVEVGQMWRLPSRTEGQEHRLICGDCTDRAVVERVMGGYMVDVVHADPPYGMGKEKDGIANDNLYREKLDAFQMKWWTAARPFVANNGSAYIWGNAEDLWRLWYCGGLRDSERITFRNEIVWDKKSGQGMGSESHRMYPTASERVLFFMLGEQGFNNNADNYWEKWEGLRLYLYGEVNALKLQLDCSLDDLGKQLGVSGRMIGHWITRSQWEFIGERHYENLKTLAKNHDGFKREYDELKREYDELKREFYATRAYFDNTHENMTDVWDFDGLIGDDRLEHATPKPVPMVERVIKSSCPDGGIVYVPFAGTLPEAIAAENLSRQCRAIEIAPNYCSVILQRYFDAFGIRGELVG